MNSRGRVQVVAHRGASGYAPETTLEAYDLALKMGVDFVEMDIHMTRDGVLVAIHDADVRRTTDGQGWISELTVSGLKKMDAGSWFNRAHRRKARHEYKGIRVPTLQEVLDLVKDSSAGCYIEIKNPERYPGNLESELLSILRATRMERRTRVLSFSARSIGKINALDSSVQTSLLVSRRTRDPVSATLQLRADELGIRYDLATPGIADAAHKKGLSLSVWTVDRKPDMERMIRMGADRIITNYPDRLLKLLQPVAS